MKSWSAVYLKNGNWYENSSNGFVVWGSIFNHWKKPPPFWFLVSCCLIKWDAFLPPSYNIFLFFLNVCFSFVMIFSSFANSSSSFRFFTSHETFRWLLCFIIFWGGLRYFLSFPSIFSLVAFLFFGELFCLPFSAMNQTKRREYRVQVHTNLIHYSCDPLFLYELIMKYVYGLSNLTFTHRLWVSWLPTVFRSTSSLQMMRLYRHSTLPWM